MKNFLDISIESIVINTEKSGENIARRIENNYDQYIPIKNNKSETKNTNLIILNKNI